MATLSSPHQAPSSVWFYNHFPLSVAWGFWITFRWRMELKPKTSGVDKSIGIPLPARPTEPPSSVFYSPLCKLGDSGAKHVRARPTPIEPPAVFFTPISASLEQNMFGPPHPAVILTLFSVAWGPHPLADPRPTRPTGSGHAHHLAGLGSLWRSCKNTLSKENNKPFLQERFYMSIGFSNRINKYCFSRS